MLALLPLLLLPLLLLLTLYTFGTGTATAVDTIASNLTTVGVAAGAPLTTIVAAAAV